MSTYREADAAEPQPSSQQLAAMRAGVEVMRPLLVGVGRVNLELAGFAAARTRAWMDAHSALMRCRTPQEVVATQVGFMQAAGRDWLEASRRIGAAWQSAIPSFDGTRANTEPGRDYMDLAASDRSDAPRPAVNGHASDRKPATDRRKAA